MKKIKKIKIQEIEPMFKVGEKVMLKDNLIIVKIKSIQIKRNRYCYFVFYPHLYPEGTDFYCFSVMEDEIKEIPFDYNQVIFNAYLEYRKKYEELLERLKSPQYRDKF